jgi:DNA-binding CsgD family transcriptional regulator
MSAARVDSSLYGWLMSSHPLTPVQPLRPAARPRNLISRAECRVLAFSALGYTKEETADFLNIGAETVKSQRASILRKMKARNMAHAVAVGFVHDLLNDEVIERVEEYVQATRQNAKLVAARTVPAKPAKVAQAA